VGVNTDVVFEVDETCRDAFLLHTRAIVLSPSIGKGAAHSQASYALASGRAPVRQTVLVHSTSILLAFFLSNVCLLDPSFHVGGPSTYEFIGRSAADEIRGRFAHEELVHTLTDTRVSLL